MRGRKGFSLVELIIVIAIITILSAIIIPHFSDELKLAHETAAIQMIKTIQSMEAQYYAQFGRFADSLAELGPRPQARD